MSEGARGCQTSVKRQRLPRNWISKEIGKGNVHGSRSPGRFDGLGFAIVCFMPDELIDIPCITQDDPQHLVRYVRDLVVLDLEDRSLVASMLIRQDGKAIGNFSPIQPRH